MLDWLNTLDHRLFLVIHHWRFVMLDAVMPWLSNRWIWIPLYLFILAVLVKIFRKKFWMIAVTVALLIFATDQTANLLKNNICRLRPCHDPTLSGMVITPSGCGGAYGFVSGHAANTFALATFLWLLSATFPPQLQRLRKWWLLLFPWAILISWSRIYLGVHFPFDVLCGAIVGEFWAFFFFFACRRFVLSRIRKAASDR